MELKAFSSTAGLGGDPLPPAADPPSKWKSIAGLLLTVGVSVFGVYPLAYLLTDTDDAGTRLPHLLAILIVVPLLSTALIGVIYAWRVKPRLRDESHTIHEALAAVVGDWTYEAVQLAFSVVAAASYVLYSYSVVVAQANYPFGSPDGRPLVFYVIAQQPFVENDAVAFVDMEYALAILLLLDLLLHLVLKPSHERLRHLVSWYTVVDLVAFSSVAYTSILHKDSRWQRFTPYDNILLSGVFRFLRLRRALQTVDDARPGNSYQIFGFTVTSKVVSFILLGARVSMFLLVSTGVMLMLEAPCEFLGTGDKDACHVEFQSFHLTMYFIICTLSTVGYGDVFPSTDPGRAFVSILIVVMLISIPNQINKVAEFWDPDTRMDDVLAATKRIEAALGVAGSASAPLSKAELAALATRLRERWDAKQLEAVLGGLGGHNGSEDLAMQVVCRLFGRNPSPAPPMTHSNHIYATSTVLNAGMVVVKQRNMPDAKPE